MSNTLQEFAAKFRVKEYTIYANRSWTWSVRPVHSTLGAGILSLNRFARSFGELQKREAADLGQITTAIESCLRRTYDYEKINYLMLMMVDAHLHFHVVPRYSQAKTAYLINWEDSGWPALPNLAQDQSTGDPKVLLAIRDALRSNLK